MTVTGTTEVIRANLRNPITGAPEDAAEGTLSLEVVAPDGTVSKYTMAEVEHEGEAGTGKYWKAFLTTQTGLHHFRWYVSGEAADEGVFETESTFIPTGPDLFDLQVVVPKARRKTEGPFGNPNGKRPFTNAEIYNMVADATGELAMLGQAWWHNHLVVKTRDPQRGFPTEWRTETVLSEYEAAIICAQVALDYYYQVFRDMKIAETIQNEGTMFSFQVSANVLRNYLEGLKDEREKAIAGLRVNVPVMDRWASNIRVRDQATVAVLEWWDYNSPGISGGGLPGGQEATSIPWFPGPSDGGGGF